MCGILFLDQDVYQTLVFDYISKHLETQKNHLCPLVFFYISYNSDYLVHLLLSFIIGITTKPEHELTFDTANSSLIPHNEFYKRRCFASTKIDVRFWTDKK